MTTQTNIPASYSIPYIDLLDPRRHDPYPNKSLREGEETQNSRKTEIQNPSPASHPAIRTVNQEKIVNKSPLASQVAHKAIYLSLEMVESFSMGYLLGELGAFGQNPSANIALFFSLSVPAKQLTLKTLQKISRCTPSTPLRNIAVQVTSLIGGKAISAVACNQLGYPINTYELITTTATGLVQMAAITATALAVFCGFSYGYSLLNPETKELNDESADKTLDSNRVKPINEMTSLKIENLKPTLQLSEGNGTDFKIKAA